MTFNIIGKNLTLTESIKSKIHDKFDRLNKYIDDDSSSGTVVVRTSGDDQIVEITIVLKNKKIIRVEKRDKNLYNAIDIAEDVLKRQLRRVKEKYKNKYKDTINPNDDITLDEECEESKYLELFDREKILDAEYMTDAEAIDEMEITDHDFYIFDSMDTDKISVVYKRKSGGYGIIRCE